MRKRPNTRTFRPRLDWIERTKVAVGVGCIMAILALTLADLFDHQLDQVQQMIVFGIGTVLGLAMQILDPR